ncbi:MAG TPA: transcriptional regulator, partial [Thermoanaerobaculia bacterium]|nr:transcriptional regulator [Thermoanaerobaculia bacterium]
MTTPARHGAYDFGPFRLDARGHRLLRDTGTLPLKPKAFDMLLLFVENPGRVVTKEEILGALWPDTIVEEASLSQNVYEIRKALGDSERPHRYLENVPKRGYRFIAAVAPAGDAASMKPSIAVLPF